NKGPLELIGDIFLITENHFVGWTIMPRKIDDKALNHPVGDAARFIQLPNVKQIPRVLSIKRSDQLAPVKLIRRQYWKIEFNAKPIARARMQPELRDALTDGRQLLVDVSQSFIPASLPWKINNININR